MYGVSKNPGNESSPTLVLSLRSRHVIVHGLRSGWSAQHAATTGVTARRWRPPLAGSGGRSSIDGRVGNTGGVACDGRLRPNLLRASRERRARTAMAFASRPPGDGTDPDATNVHGIRAPGAVTGGVMAPGGSPPTRPDTGAWSTGEYVCPVDGTYYVSTSRHSLFESSAFTHSPTHR